MRFLRSLPAWALFFAATSGLVGAASLDDQCLSELCVEPQIQHNAVRAVRPTPASLARKSMTNAERLSRGLAPNPPARRQHAARQQPSITPKSTYHGHIEMRSSGNGQALGWVSSVLVGDGLMTLTSNSAEALKVSFSLDSGDTSGTGLRLTAQGTEVPLLGFIVGRGSPGYDISTSTFNFLYLNPIDLPGTSPRSPPQNLDSVYAFNNRISTYGETDLWNIDIATGQMLPQWTNTDGSAAPTVVFAQSGNIYAGGSISQYKARYPNADVTELSFAFVLEDTSG